TIGTVSQAPATSAVVISPENQPNSPLCRACHHFPSPERPVTGRLRPGVVVSIDGHSVPGPSLIFTSALKRSQQSTGVAVGSGAGSPASCVVSDSTHALYCSPISTR